VLARKQLDLKKLQPYYERKIRHYQDLFRKQLHEELEAELAGKSLTEQFRILTKKKIEYDKLLKQREYQRHQIEVTIDLDHVIDGYPGLKVWPQKSADFTLPSTFSFLFVKKGETKSMGNFTLSRSK